MGPNDRVLTSTLTMARIPIFDKLWSHTNVCVWDVAAAHLLHEDALRRNPEESAGQAFLISGKGPAWRLRDIRNAVKVGGFRATQLVGPGADIWDSTTHLVLSSSTKYHLYWCTSSRMLWNSCYSSATMHCCHFMCSAGRNLSCIRNGWASLSICSPQLWSICVTSSLMIRERRRYSGQ
jgi:hypothetical protein